MQLLKKKAYFVALWTLTNNHLIDNSNDDLNYRLSFIKHQKEHPVFNNIKHWVLFHIHSNTMLIVKDLFYSG